MLVELLTEPSGTDEMKQAEVNTQGVAYTTALAPWRLGMAPGIKRTEDQSRLVPKEPGLAVGSDDRRPRSDVSFARTGGIRLVLCWVWCLISLTLSLHAALRPSEAQRLEQVRRIGVLLAGSPPAIRAATRVTHTIPTEVKVVVARCALGSCLRLWG